MPHLPRCRSVEPRCPSMWPEKLTSRLMTQVPVTTSGHTTLSRRVLSGYALGSLVTGAFGTVPGLLLAPYLTDTLGVAAGVAGVLVWAPKAWDVLVNPV